MLIAQKIALILTIIGGLNWLLVGTLDFNLVTYFFNEGSVMTRTIYIIIGISSLFNIGFLFVKGFFLRTKDHI